MTFNWAPAISRDIAFAKLAGKTPDAIAMNPAIYNDLRLRIPKVWMIDYDRMIDRPTFDGIPIALDERCETYRFL